MFVFLPHTSNSIEAASSPRFFFRGQETSMNEATTICPSDLHAILIFCSDAILKGVTGGPSGPSREVPDVGLKIVSDTKQMTKERKKKKGMGKGKNM